MKSKKAIIYLNHIFKPMSGQNKIKAYDRDMVCKAIEIAEQEVEDQIRKELIQWHYIEEKLPSVGKVVLVKTDSDPDYILAKRCYGGWHYANLREWEISADQIIRWREII